MNTHLLTLQTCLTTLMGHPISMEQLRLDVGHMVEKMTQITIMFRRIKLKMEEYVCLKVYILLNQGNISNERSCFLVLWHNFTDFIVHLCFQNTNWKAFKSDTFKCCEATCSTHHQIIQVDLVNY